MAETKKTEEKKTLKKTVAAAKQAVAEKKAAVKAAKPAAEKKPAAKAAKPAAAKKPAAKAAAKPAAKKAAVKKPAAKKAVEVIIQSPLGGNITPEEILAKVGKADKIYIRVDENKAYWVRDDKTGSVDLWD